MGVRLEHIQPPNLIEGEKKVTKEPAFASKMVELFSFMGLSKHKIDLVCCNYNFPIQSKTFKYLKAKAHYDALDELAKYI